MTGLRGWANVEVKGFLPVEGFTRSSYDIDLRGLRRAGMEYGQAPAGGRRADPALCVRLLDRKSVV